MEPIEIAYANAANGWPQFPVQPGSSSRPKTPYPGFTDWEQRATTSAELISVWGTVDYPGCDWATTPGRVDKTVIDVDQHPGKPDGFEVLLLLGVNLGTPHVFGSISGRGRHAWYRGRTSSRNDLYTSIDRKSVGGYVITPYLLPGLEKVRTRLPSAFQGRTAADEGLHPYEGSESAWLEARVGLTMSRVVTGVVRSVEAEEFRGHRNMLAKQARLIHLGRDGHGGVPEALDRLREMWVSAEHGANEDPVREWSVGLRGAIRAYGGVGDAGQVVGRDVRGSVGGGAAGGLVVDEGDGVDGSGRWGLEAAAS